MTNTNFTKNIRFSMRLGKAMTWMLAIVFLLGFTNELAATCLPAPTLSNCSYLGTFDNKFYYKFNGNNMNCPSAASTCFQYGGRLPKIKSAAHNNWLRGIVSGKFWLDLSDHHNEGSWKHQDVSSPFYTKWALFSPSILSWLTGGNDFSYMDHDGYWKDCDNAYNVGTIIELPCHSVASTIECDITPSVPNSHYLGQFENSHYFRINSGTYDAHQANAICLSNGGHLPRVKSAAQNQWLKDKLGSHTLWIDLNDVETEGQWRYQDGLLTSFLNWNAGEPNNYGGIEHYVEMNASTGKWNDNDLSIKRTVVVEIPCKADACLTTSAPAITTTTVTNSCPTSSINLNGLDPVFTPSDFSISWHTGTPASDGNKVSSPTTAGAGDYYAVFQRDSDGCYAGEGEKTTKVTATVGSCDNLVRLKNRTYDGTLNNITNSEAAKFGSVGQIYARELPADYGDGISSLAGPNRPNPRALSNKLSNEPEDQHNDRDMAGMFYIWGQFIDHDMNENRTNPDDPAPISIPSSDTLFTNPISLNRSQATPGTGVTTPRQQTNFNTSWLDGSQVYGTSDAQATWLRSFENGKMKTSKGDMLPYNTLTGEKDAPIDPTAPRMDNDQGGTQKVFVAGDHRASEHTGTTSLHTLFVREHNRICDGLVKQGWDNEEEIYQRARKIVGALIQRVTYNQWMESMGIVIPSYQGYDPTDSPDILNTFATGAYRWHTMVENDIILRDNECNGVGDVEIPLRDVFFNPSIIETYDIGVILKGLSVHRQYETDLKVTGGLRNFLFGNFGTDLVSINIQRGRDHGLPSYNDVREFYTGSRAHSFHDITSVDSIADAMSSIYDSVDDVDLWVGLYAEPHVSGKSIGKTVHALIAAQFAKIRDGDFYFYKNDPELSGYLSEIESTNLDDIISRNSNAGNFQDNVFFRKFCDSEGDDLAKTPCNVASPFNNWTYLGRTNSGSGHDSKFYLRDGGAMTYDDANEVTLTLAGHLPQINDHSENETLNGLLNGEAAWLDIVRSGSGWRYSPQFNGDDVLVQGSSVSFFNWDTGQPDDWQNNEDRVEIRSNGKWNDLNGNALRLAVAEQECQDISGSCLAGEAAPAINDYTCINICPATTIDISHIVAFNQPLHTVLTWHTSSTASNSNRIYDLTNLPEGTYYAAFYSPDSDCYNGSGHKTAKFIAINVGCEKPVEASLSADCDNGTADLSVYTPTGQPSNTTLTWHTAFPQTVTNRVLDITAVAPGIYYAAFKRNSDNKLYNVATIEVTAPDCIENVCPATLVDLNAAYSSDNTPAGTTLTWHTGIPATDANRIADLEVGNGNYYAAFRSDADNCYAGNGFNVKGVGVKIVDCVAITIADVTVEEDGGAAILTVTLDVAADVPVTVDYTTMNGDALDGNDYTMVNGTVTIPAGQLTAEISVPIIDDNVNEPMETFKVVLSNPMGADIADNEAEVKINDNDPAIVPMVSIADVTVEEDGGAAILTVTLDVAADVPVTVDYTTMNGDALDGNDYTMVNGSVTIPAGQLTAEISVSIIDDNVNEPMETFKVVLSNPMGADIADNEAEVKINDNDPAIVPFVSIADASVTEDAGIVNLSVTLNLSSPSPTPITVDYTTMDGAAIAGSDYTATSGMVTFPSNTVSATITVVILDDDINEPTETFTVKLDNPVGALIADDEAVVVITDDDMVDPCAGLGGDSDGDGVCDDNDCQPNDAAFPATPGTACDDGNANTINDMVTADGCGCEGTPVNNDPDCANIIITSGASSITVSGLDGAPVSSLQVFNSSWQQEFSCFANCGATETLNNLPAGDYYVYGKYYTASYALICQEVKTVTVGGNDPCAGLGGDSDGDGVCDDNDCQPNDAAFPATPGAACDDGNANTNNDMVTADGCACEGTPVNVTPSLSINDVTVNENDGTATLTVTLSAPSASFVAVLYNTSNGTADLTDYSTTTGTLAFPANQVTATIVVPILNDNVGELTEKFDVNLSSPVGATLADANGEVTILDDDMVDPCAGLGGDSDGDGVCDDNDCQPNNAAFPATPGTACNDGNSNTINDMVTADGCGCEGTPVNNDPDCANIIITSGASSITVSGLDGAPISSLQVFNSSWQQEFSCFANCGATETLNNLPAGDYYVYGKYYTASYALICQEVKTVTVGGNDPCAGLGGDSDGDGVCDDNDCQPNNAAFPATPGAACNDGNSNTINDMVTADGCGCEGTPVTPPTCDNYTLGGTIGFGGTCDGSIDYCPSNGAAPTIGNCAAPTGGSGNLEVIWLKSTTSCSIPTTTAADIIAGLDPDWSLLSSVNTLSFDLDNLTESTCYLRCVRRAGCDTYIESNIISVNVPTNCGGNNGTPDCANISIAAGTGQINVDGLDGAPVVSVQVFTSSWQQIYNCFGDCGGPAESYPVSGGIHYVYVKYYSASYQLICEATETINVVSSLISSGDEELNIEAVKYEEHAEIVWSHNRDYNVETYTVERSANGDDFEEINTQDSDTDVELDVYRDYDFAPLKGDNFYRLRMVLNDGSIGYSEVKLLHYVDLDDYLIFPNPANEFAKVDLEAKIGKEVHIFIFDNKGLRRKAFFIDEVYSKYYEMDLRELNEGHYTVWINEPGRMPVAKTLVIGKI